MRGALCVPGDKSLAHRSLILGTLATGESRVRGLPDSLDVRATERALRALGAAVREEGVGARRICGPTGWRDAPEPIDLANSGTSARLLTGLVAGTGRSAVLDGDASLRGRPMDRVVYPLQAMGARIRYLGERDRLPIHIEGRATGSLRVLRYRPRVASAQVKGSLLLAAVASRTEVEIREPGLSRDHTERLLGHLGAPVSVEEPTAGSEDAEQGICRTVRFEPRDWEGRLAPFDLELPGDPSSAAFLLAAGLLTGRPVRVERVGLNPGRTAYLEVLEAMGARVERSPREHRAGEPVGDLEAHPGPLRGVEVGGEAIPRLLDEIPVLAVLAARATGDTVFRDASELRVKESDRLGLLAENLRGLGVEAEERPDGLRVRGADGPLAGRVRTGGDHRIAMAFGVLGATSGAAVEVDDVDCVAVSYPGFWEALARVVGR